jgi:CRISPR-associated protein Csh2
VEYENESFHLGGLTRDLDIDEERSAPVDELRNVREFTLDGTELVSRLGRHADRIARVRVVASDVLDVTVGDEIYTAGDKPSEHGFYDALREAVGDAVEVVDVYDEAAATMPK